MYGTYYYRPQQHLQKGNVFTSMCEEFCPGGGVHGKGGVHSGGHVWQGGMCGRGHVWQGACMAGGMHGRWACMTGECAWQGCAWQGEACVAGEMTTGVDTSYWNAFLVF